MTELRRRDVVTDLDTVGLDELIATADLRDRFDVKYVVAISDVPAMVDGLARGHGDVRALDIEGRRHHGCLSHYFDTAGLQLFRAQAQERRRRFKVRTRSYATTATAMLEMKFRDGTGRTLKHRVPHAELDATVLGAAAEREIAELLNTRYRMVGPGELVHTATVAFERATLLIGGSRPERVTIDRGLAVAVAGRRVELGCHWAVVEVKTGGRSATATRTLRALGHHPTPVSKYALALTAAHPDVRGNRWLHLLHRLAEQSLQPPEPVGGSEDGHRRLAVVTEPPT